MAIKNFTITSTKNSNVKLQFDYEYSTGTTFKLVGIKLLGMGEYYWPWFPARNASNNGIFLQLDSYSLETNINPGSTAGDCKYKWSSASEYLKGAYQDSYTADV